MRFVAAIASFVIAFLLIGVGIAQRTILAEPNQVTSAVDLSSKAPITIIDGAALNVRDGRQKVEISGSSSDTVFAAYGRTGDLIAWAGDTSYNYITFDEASGELSSTLKTGSSAEAPNPEGSDLWLGEYSHADSLAFTLNVPSNISVIVLTNGVDPAPANVAVTWPLDNRAPLSGPLIIAGVLMLLLGLGLYLWGLAHLRKMHGPRRKPPAQQKLPKQPRYNYRKATKAIRQAKPKAIEKPKGRRSIGRMTAVLPSLLITAVVLSGCTASDWPEFLGGSADVVVPTPSATAEDGGEIGLPPAVTVPQLESIVQRISTVAAKADADLDPALAETRFTGAALELRNANYAIRTVDNSIAALSAIPSSPVALTLPQQSETWPRWVFTIIQGPAKGSTATDSAVTDPATADPAAPDAAAPEEAAPAEPAVVPTALMLVQETPRANYKVAYAMVMEASAEVPKVAGATVGAVRQDPTNKMLKIKPSELAASYADVMLNGEESEFFSLFDFGADALMPEVGTAAKAARAEKLSTTALEYSSAPGVGEPIALATSNAGVIVSVSTNEIESAKPKETGAVLSPVAGTKALSGVEKTTSGVSATYAYQLLFYVPPTTSDAKIVLLGFSEGLVAAKEL